MQTFGTNGKMEYITGVRLHTNVTSSDYYPNTSNIGPPQLGGLCILGWYNCIKGFNAVASAGFAPYLPMFRDVSMDIAAAALGDPNFDSHHACRRVLPQDNPPTFTPQSPEIGQLYTEYFNDAMAQGGGGGFSSNPMPVGAFLTYTADYNFDANGNNVAPLVAHVPGNAWNIVIPAHYNTKTYKFRLSTDIYTAN